MKIMNEAYENSSICHNTLTVIKSKPDGGASRVFGGFTNIKWSTFGGSCGFENKSFLFSVRDKGQVEILHSRKGKDEVYH